MTGLLQQPLAEAFPDAPSLTAETITGGLWNIASSRIRSGRPHELPIVGRALSTYMLGNLSPRR